MADILIRDMEMPKHCIDCPCMVDKYSGDNCCLQSEEANEKITSWDDMKAGCPLVELPEHGNLIDRDAFREENEYYLHREFINPKYEDTLDDLLKDAPVIVPASKEETE